VPTPRGADLVVEAIVEVAGKLRDQAGSEVGAIGLGAPGLVDRSGTLRMGPNLPGVVDLELTRVLAGRLSMPVVVDNDATAAAWGEHEWGAAKGRNHSMTISLGTGIGAGFTVKGEVLRGANGFAGEPGHMIVNPNGPLCPCGQRGCWERYASGSGLGRLAREAAHAGVADALVERAGGEPEDVRGEHVTAAARDGDPAAREVLGRFAWWVALGLANLVNILDSEVIVIAGGLAEAGDLILEPTREAYRGLVLAADRRPEVPIVVAELGERAAAIGAALLAAART
jgi:glucokinase